MAKSLHEKRKVTFQELGALYGTRTMMANHVLVHDPQQERVYNNKHGFNMATQGKQHGCGTVSCIGGTMAFIMGADPIMYVGMRGKVGTASRVFQDLFYPNVSKNYCNKWITLDSRTNGEGWNKITPAQGVKAIDNWLRTGKPQWLKVLRG